MGEKQTRLLFPRHLHSFSSFEFRVSSFVLARGKKGFRLLLRAGSQLHALAALCSGV